MDLNSINEFLAAAIRMSAPLMIVGAGALFTERTGAINLFSLGVTNLLNGPLYAGYEYRPRVTLYPVIAPEALQNLPILGPILFAQPVIVYFAFILPILATWI